MFCKYCVLIVTRTVDKTLEVKFLEIGEFYVDLFIVECQSTSYFQNSKKLKSAVEFQKSELGLSLSLKTEIGDAGLYTLSGKISFYACLVFVSLVHDLIDVFGQAGAI